MRHVLAAVLSALAAVAAPRPATAEAAAPVTAERVARAPRPDAAVRFIVPRPEPVASPWRRVVTAAPRAALAVAFAPVRLALWAEDRYHVSGLARELTWNDDRTLGATPVIGWESGLAFRAGGQLAAIDRDGAGVRARATAGARERWAAAITADSGRHLGRAHVELGVSARDVTSAAYFGRGDAGTEARYALDERSARAVATWTAGPVELGAGGSLRYLDFAGVADDDHPSIDAAYAADELPGFARGVRAVRGELSARLDRRRARSPWQSRAVPSSGGAVHAHAGWQHDLSTGAGYGYGGLDAIAAVDLYGGDRVLSVRGVVDAVAGDLADVPFVDVPALGGTNVLRGYPAGRLRDRWAAAVVVQYDYPVTHGLGGFAFAEVGGVAGRLADLADARPKASGGVGVQLHTMESVIAQVWIAASEDGDVRASVQLAAAFGRRGREVVR